MKTLFYSSMIAAAAIVTGAQLYGMERFYWQDFPGVGFVSPSPQSTPESSPSGSPRLAPSSPHLRSGCLALQAIKTQEQLKENTEIAEEKKISKQ